MQTPQRFRPEAEPTPAPPSDIEKDIENLKSLRKLRLDKMERDYRQKKKLVTQAEEAVNQQIDVIRNLQIKTKDEKKRLHESSISQSTQAHLLMQWIEYEHTLDEAIQQSIRDLIPFQKKVEEAREIESKSKAVFRQAQMGIEKLEILEKELENETP